MVKVKKHIRKIGRKRFRVKAHSRKTKKRVSCPGEKRRSKGKGKGLGLGKGKGPMRKNYSSLLRSDHRTGEELLRDLRDSWKKTAKEFDERRKEGSSFRSHPVHGGYVPDKEIKDLLFEITKNQRKK